MQEVFRIEAERYGVFHESFSYDGIVKTENVEKILRCIKDVIAEEIAENVVKERNAAIAETQLVEEVETVESIPVPAKEVEATETAEKPEALKQEVVGSKTVEAEPEQPSGKRKRRGGKIGYRERTTNIIDFINQNGVVTMDEINKKFKQDAEDRSPVLTVQRLKSDGVVERLERGKYKVSDKYKENLTSGNIKSLPDADVKQDIVSAKAQEQDSEADKESDSNSKQEPDSKSELVIRGPTGQSLKKFSSSVENEYRLIFDVIFTRKLVKVKFLQEKFNDSDFVIQTVTELHKKNWLEYDTTRDAYIVPLASRIWYYLKQENRVVPQVKIGIDLGIDLQADMWEYIKALKYLCRENLIEATRYNKKRPDSDTNCYKVIQTEL